MARNQRHVVRNPNGGWDVKKPGAQRASAHLPTQSAAEQRAKQTSATTAAARPSSTTAAARSATPTRWPRVMRARGTTPPLDPPLGASLRLAPSGQTMEREPA